MFSESISGIELMFRVVLALAMVGLISLGSLLVYGILWLCRHVTFIG
jgi:hypothetical protein